MKNLGDNLRKFENEENETLSLNNEAKYKLMLEAVNDIMWEWNIENNKFNMLGNYELVIDFNLDNINSMNDFIEKIVHIDFKEKVKLELKNHLKDKSLYFQSEFKVCTKNGHEKWILMRGKSLKSPKENPIWMAGSITDTTDRKIVEERIEYLAYHDLLTRLPNNIYFSSLLNESINKGKGTVLFIGIDNLKKVNDTLGHDYGDLLLKIASELLKLSIIRYGLVSRFSGDIFAILIPDIESKGILSDISENIIKSFKNPFEVREMQVYCSVSIGIATFPEHGRCVSDILKHADTAMHNTKINGKDDYSFYDDKIEKSIMIKGQIESCLRDALNSNGFELYYQPQINIKNNKISGLEVLLRLKSSKLGFISPEEFIPIAEETGLILKIGEWVLNSSCKQCKEWIDKGYDFQKISINISPVQMKKKYFLEIVNKAISKNDLNPEFLELEITEGTLIESIEKNADLLNELISIGIKVSLDDFGKGYSSLNYLTALPINTLKIDKSFIDNINEDSRHKAIVNCIINLAKNLNYEVIAEGVEDGMQKGELYEMGCDCIQGYYYSKPLPKDEIEKFMLNNKFD
ncbi:GGDEF and EAL domain-containing protein [Clostridium sp.]|uniref:bifunctional diguanylate cyclase/phosphodiesterase n=1 Tax=Clostridium sp. TaxID=1506 RepID=UPI002588B261|nr:GGDEF and EAL domain-containing protein [Clostridium sp.]MDF2503472.1 diguanylate cyclase protein [Clostridium sp.]